MFERWRAVPKKLKVDGYVLWLTEQNLILDNMLKKIKKFRYSLGGFS